MAKRVGLSRKLKLSWLNKAAELALEGLPEQEIREQLNAYLRFEIESPINIRKTREILMQTWVYESGKTGRLRPSALELMRTCPQCALEIHWCMLLAAYPVFADVCRLMGKISAFQDEITLARLRQSLFDEWGERTTLLHSLDKLMATFKELEAVTCDRPGRYRVRPHCVSNPAVAAFMVYTMMLVDNGGYYTLADIHASAYFFPFQYRVETELLFADSRFAIQQFGGELSVSLSE